MVILFLWMAIEVHAANYGMIVFRAFEANERMSADDWAFTETYTAEGVIRISRFDPHRPGASQSLDERYPLNMSLI